MKRILIVIAASALVASAANAAFDVTVDVDKTEYQVGEVVSIDLTLTTDGTHTLGAFGVFEYEATWDPSFLRVDGSDPGSGDGGVAEFGSASQTIFPELDGSTTPACPNTGNTCFTLSQFNGNLSSTDVSGVVTGTLLLEILDGAGTLLSTHLTQISNEIGSEIADSVTVGSNYAVATIVPEPTTAALIGLGLIGLGVAGRRR